MGPVHRIVIVGAGATGFLGARMAGPGSTSRSSARGAHLAAMRERGVEVRAADGPFVVRPPCTDDLRSWAAPTRSS